MSSPATLLTTQLQLQSPPFVKELMSNPRLGPLLSVDSSTLDINILIRSIKVLVPDSSRLACQGTLNAGFLEHRRDDQVHVLSGDREETEDRPEKERTHGAGVIVSGKTAGSVVELGGDVCVASLSRKSGTTGVVVHIDS